VPEDMRRDGIGKALFLSAADWARKQGAKKLYISAHSAIENKLALKNCEGRRRSPSQFLLFKAFASSKAGFQLLIPQYGGKSMRSETSMAAAQYRLQGWAAQIRECQSRPAGMSAAGWRPCSR